MKWHELELEQKRPLDQKIALAQDVIRQAFTRATLPALAFSGGKDSTVLLDLIRRTCPDQARSMPVIYGNTGVEFPECVQFTRALARDLNLNLHEATPGRTRIPSFKYAAQHQLWLHLIKTNQIHAILKPDGKLKSLHALERACPPDLRAQFEQQRLVWPAGTKKTYWWCTDQYGWPLLGKSWSRLAARRVNINTFLRFSQSESTNPSLLTYYEILRQVKISQYCCQALKKEPAHRLQSQLGCDLSFMGLMASESRRRALNFLDRGYLYQVSRPDIPDRPFFHCQPMAVWTDADVWAYIARYNLPYAPLYDITYTSITGGRKKIARNGCFGCATDLRFADNHLRILRQTHPRMWHVLMQRGMGDQIRNLQRALRPAGQLTLSDIFSTGELLEMQPCVFDDLDGRGGQSPPPGLVYDPETEAIQ